jgi:putative tryptophan/tyrosine transport system substrate-binding protein
MRRREFIAGLGSAAAWPIAGLAQGLRKRPLIGWLSGLTQIASSTYQGNFLQGMKELGYIEGSNFDMVYRLTEGFQDRLPSLTEELVRLKPDAIIATAVINTVVARNATSTIPIICPALADAVHLGLITSEARPGGNVTGIEQYVAGLPGKQMEFAREMVPGARGIGLLTNPKDQKVPAQVEEFESIARAIGVKIIVAHASRPDEIEGAFQALEGQRVDVVIVLQTSLFLSENRQITASALAKRLPTVFGYREHVLTGGLISYGVDLRWCFRRSASFVDKILHGAVPGDLPVEFPTKVVLAINLKTAKALGLDVPETLLATADELIK